MCLGQPAFGEPKRFRPAARGWWQRRLPLDQDSRGSYLYCIGNPKVDWGFKTEPEPGLNGRAIDYPRGKVLGGCSSINGMIYMRGQARDYDYWAQLGNLAGAGMTSSPIS